jgi:hypothetical protein
MSKESPETPITQISSAQEFKKRREAREAGDVLTLASGLSVRLKRPEVTKLIAQGLLPANMLQRFMAIQKDLQSSSKEVKAEDLELILKFQRTVAKHALLEPTISDEPDYDKNEIALDDLDDADLEEIWTYANGGLEAVDSFRKERDARILPGPDSDKIPEQTT